MKHSSPSFYLPGTQQRLDVTADTSKENARSNCWDISLSTVVSSPTVASAFDVLSVIEFDPTNTIITTGGITLKIKVYAMASLLVAEDCQGERSGNVSFIYHVTTCDYYICTPAKLSSLWWRLGTSERVLGSGDYDGVVTEYDLETWVPVLERDEHGGRRVYSVDYSHWESRVGASGSEDGTMQMWDTRSRDGWRCVATVEPSEMRRLVCCMEFSPVGGGALVGVGCEDRKAYTYDVQRLSKSVRVLEGHEKAMSYMRLVDGGRMVTAGIDGCLKLWDVNKGGEI